MSSVIEDYVKASDKEAPATSKNSNVEDDDIDAKRESLAIFATVGKC